MGVKRSILLICLATCCIMAQQDSGTLHASIEQALAGSLQEITFTYTLGDEAITEGGGIRFEFPVAYAETEFLFWSKPQTKEADLLGFVSAMTSTGQDLICTSYGIAGGIFQCMLPRGTLNAGDEILVSYKGVVQSLARNFKVRAEIKTSADKPWDKIVNPPHIKILPHDAKTMIATSPADLRVDEPFDLAIVVLDKFGNLASGFRGNVRLQSTDKLTILPEAYTFTEEDNGKRLFRNLKYRTPGFQQISIKTADEIKTSIHYSWVSESEIKFRRYFGDTHFHTGSGTRNRGFFGAAPKSHDHHSADINVLPLKAFQHLNAGGDHRGNFTTAEEAYTYAKEVVRLDFASASEHDVALFDNEAWDISQSTSERFYEPGRFTTLFAYEWTAGITHHIVMYKDPGLKVFNRRDYPDLLSLWQALDEQGRPALTLPHLTWDFEEHTNWNHINNVYRRIGEIYSLWNGRYLVQPGDEPQRFELGKDDKWSYQHAWSKGHKIGVVGSTDNHLGRPGANNYTIYTQHTGGLAAVLSKANNRDQLWNALENRRTYATSGTRIYLDFTVNGHPMGSEIESHDHPVIAGRAGGTNKLEKIEVIKYDGEDYTTIYSSTPNSAVAEFTTTDQEFDSDCFYYFRITQTSEVPGRLWTFPTHEMAWSSPIWVTAKK